MAATAVAVTATVTTGANATMTTGLFSCINMIVTPLGRLLISFCVGDVYCGVLCCFPCWKMPCRSCAGKCWGSPEEALKKFGGSTPETAGSLVWFGVVLGVARQLLLSLSEYYSPLLSRRRTRAVREWLESGARVVREWYESGTRVVREWYESGTRVVRDWYESDRRVVGE